jgi:hypothetical protein
MDDDMKPFVCAHIQRENHITDKYCKKKYTGKQHHSGYNAMQVIHRIKNGAIKEKKKIPVPY